MSGKIQLQIPKPCHEKWSEMTPAEKGRFCSSCQKVVVDFSRMGDRELAQFFKKASGPVCGRFTGDQLHRDIDLPKKRIPWARYFFSFAIPAFLLSLKSSAQGRVRVVENPSTIAISPKEKKEEPAKAERPVKDSVSLIVRDQDGNPLYAASVTVLPSGKTMITDEKGALKFLRGAEDKSVRVSYVGLEVQEMALPASGQGEIILVRMEQMWLGEPVTVTHKPRKPMKGLKKWWTRLGGNR
jgi:hypothetical protein